MHAIRHQFIVEEESKVAICFHVIKMVARMLDIRYTNETCHTNHAEYFCTIRKKSFWFAYIWIAVFMEQFSKTGLVMQAHIWF